ncbi:MAG: MoxR family ATPase [Myxococcota bacterium]|nr:MoxR family ATPase [Myxococcota bacterium]
MSNPKRQERINEFREQFQSVVANIGKVIKGKKEVIERVLISLTAGGHVMLLDVPGTGKTMLARSISASIQFNFKRIQFTPDLLPMDITGTNIFNMRSKSFEFQPGPIFTNLLLADEINRATPKTQSALLEVMAERQVTVEGKTHQLPPPFLVIATMNPLDAQQGTYQLPAAQLDRFSMQLSMGFPPPEAEMDMLDIHLAHRPVLDSLEPVIDVDTFLSWQRLLPQTFLAEEVKEYLVQLVNLIRSDSRCLTPPSPRATLMMARVAQAHAMTQGRDYVTPLDIQEMAPLVLSHRMILSGSISAQAYIRDCLLKVAAPQ